MLHALARGAARLAADRLELVHLVDEDDAALRPRDVAFRLLQQALQDGVDLLVDELRLRQRSRIRRDEGQLEGARQRLAQQRLAGAGGADQQDVALDGVDCVAPRLGDLLVVGIDGDGEDLLGLVLADDVLVEILNDGAGGHCGQLR